MVAPYIQELQMNLEQIEKGGYDHFMLKEIYEQPNVIKDTYRGRLHANKGIIQMAGVEDNLEKFSNDVVQNKDFKDNVRQGLHYGVSGIIISQFSPAI